MRIAVLAIAVASLAFAGHARAERRDCEVVFVRAPDDVRLVIEGWLKAEPRCSGTIELRVVETETGSLYLIAQRSDGRIHEREVPDAQSAGVLVASWVADDWTSSPPEEDDAPLALDGAPGVTPVATPAVVDTVPPRRTRLATGRWFAISPMIQTEGHGGVGVRFEMDMLGGRSSKWTLGVAAIGVTSSMSTHGYDSYGYLAPGYLETIDLRALVVAARTWRLGTNWNVRWSVGIGPMYTDGTAELWMSNGFTPQPTSYTTVDDLSLAYESSLTIARELFGHRWAITAGPAVTRISQMLEGVDQDIRRDKVELMFMLGARYRL
jgi:hypothetical protein